MATIVRVKRRRNEDPLENIVVSCKKQKYDVLNRADNDKSVPLDLQSSLRYAGTVSSKDDGVSKQIRSAIRKDKLEKEYKSHNVDVIHKSRQQQKQSSKASRFKITSLHRAKELDNLDQSQSEADSGDHVKSEQSTVNSAESVKCEQCEKCQKSDVKGSTDKQTSESSGTGVSQEKCTKCTCNSSQTAASPGKTVFHLYDVEVERRNTINIPTYESLLQEAQNSSNITCNTVPLVKEEVARPQVEDDFVFDLYYTNNRDFNLRLLEDSLSIETYTYDLPQLLDGEGGDDEIYEDEDDENEESNWRNDYPDEDPHFYENEDVDYFYGDDVDENQAFDHPFESLTDWMSTRCTIEDDVSSDEYDPRDFGDEPSVAQQSSYENYFRRVKQEMNELEDSVVPD